MSDAVPVKIAPGDEVAGIDIFLTLVHTVRVRGHVLSALKGSVLASPSVTLRMNDSDNTASVTAPISVTFDKDQSFEIRGVTAGPYLLLASATEDGVTLTGRVPINVGDADVANADVGVSPESLWTGKVQVDDDDSPLPKGLTISLQPRRSTASPSRAKVSEDGEFSVPFVPDEIYDLYVLNAPDDSYLKSVRIANSERLGQGLEAAPGDSPPALDVRLSSRGGAGSGKGGDGRSQSRRQRRHRCLDSRPFRRSRPSLPDHPGRRVRQFPAARRASRKVRRWWRGWIPRPAMFTIRTI